MSHRRAVSTLHLIHGTELKRLAWGLEPSCRIDGWPLRGGAGQVEPALDCGGHSPDVGLRTVARRKPLKFRKTEERENL